MTWTLFVQICALAMVLGLMVFLWGAALHGAIVDKRREDAYKRKENGL